MGNVSAQTAECKALDDNMSSGRVLHSWMFRRKKGGEGEGRRKHHEMSANGF